MSIAPLGTVPSAPVHLLQGASLPARVDVGSDDGSAQDVATPAFDAPDTATISAQAVALLQAQPGAPAQDGGWEISDTQAAQLSAAIQQADPSLFDHLDQNGDGRLNADELKTGIRQLAQQAPTDAPTAGGAAAPTPQDQLETIRQALRSMLAGGLPGAHHHHRHQAAGGAAQAGRAAAASQVLAPVAGAASAATSTAADGDADADSEASTDSPRSGSASAARQSLADLLAELDRPPR